MVRPRIHTDERARREYQSERRRAQRKEARTTFRGIDGEGVGRGRNHRYVLLGTSDRHIANNDGLSLEETFSFLYSLYAETPKAAFAGFFLGYDFTQWLKKLPRNRAEMLFTDKGKAIRVPQNSKNPYPFPVYWNDWEFDLLGMKRFKLRAKGEKSWMYVCDSGPFFQTSFLSAIDPRKWPEPVCTQEEYFKVEEGKAKRDVAELNSEMVEYNSLENQILERVLARLDDGFQRMGIKLKRSQWFGPGQAASAWMSTTELPTIVQLAKSATHKFLEWGRKAYYGGWFEIFAHGLVPGVSYEYDINSAYPHISSQLPCLLHGHWDSGTGIPRRGLPTRNIRVCHATVKGSDKHIGSMLHRRDDGTISRPNETTGYYWQHELDAAIRAGVIDEIIYLGWAEYTPCDCRPPLRGLVGLYDHRIRIGKESPEGKGAKLVYNSAYGKLAQSVGDPKYANSIYASLITAGCRTMILDAIATHPRKTDAVLMVATDAVYFTSKHPTLPLSSKIGDWEESTKSNLCLFKPGVYWDDKAREAIRRQESAVFKARGVNAKQFSQKIVEIDAHFSRWPNVYPSTQDPDKDREGWFPKVEFDAGFTMITCKQALARGKWFLAGAVGAQTVEQDSWPREKRVPGEYKDGIYWSRPFKSMPWPSADYSKTFGQEIFPPMLTEDGDAYSLISEAMRGD
jgi:hypothetical protein